MYCINMEKEKKHTKCNCCRCWRPNELFFNAKRRKLKSCQTCRDRQKKRRNKKNKVCVLPKDLQNIVIEYATPSLLEEIANYVNYGVDIPSDLEYLAYMYFSNRVVNRLHAQVQ